MVFKDTVLLKFYKLLIYLMMNPSMNLFSKWFLSVYVTFWLWTLNYAAAKKNLLWT